jgi:DNA-3-methyladenine glycosylase
MFGPAGHLYVYFTYGMHYCCNIVTGAVGHGSAVLLRAIEPIEGGEAMLANRQGRSSSRYTQLSTSSTDLTNGPAKLCQALLIDAHYNGHDLRREPLILQANPEIPEQEIVQTTRVGISQATDVPWRFYVRGNPYVSRQ